MNPEAFARLQLILTYGVGVAGTWKWIHTFGSAEEALRASFEELVAAGASESVAKEIARRTGARVADEELKKAESAKIQFLFGARRNAAGDVTVAAPPDELVLPAWLQEIDLPPVVLWARGRVELLLDSNANQNKRGSGATHIAIVGARTPTPYGVQQAARFSSELAARGAVIVSGFARGIDFAAHRAALDAGGATVAALGSGISNPYPPNQTDLLNAIFERGCVISEFALGAHATKVTFPQRNRILAGLSKATIVIEAGKASGSLITARWAESFGRPVFVVPGRVDSPMSAGCHELIRNGMGILCTDPAEVLESLGGAEGHNSGNNNSGSNNSGSNNSKAAARHAAILDDLPDAERNVLESARTGATLDEIAARFTGSEAELFGIVAGLELSGLLDRCPGGIYRSVLGSLC
ncbi:MAG: DNA-processing protein DprA [Planctomycetota bacterium]